LAVLLGDKKWAAKVEIIATGRNFRRLETQLIASTPPLAR